MERNWGWGEQSTVHRCLCLFTLERTQKWSWKYTAHLTISSLAEISVNPVSNKAVPQESREEMMLLSQFPNQNCPLMSCMMHPG